MDFLSRYGFFLLLLTLFSHLAYTQGLQGALHFKRTLDLAILEQRFRRGRGPLLPQAYAFTWATFVFCFLGT